jgi:hypothetical protein
VADEKEGLCALKSGGHVREFLENAGKAIPLATRSKMTRFMGIASRRFQPEKGTTLSHSGSHSLKPGCKTQRKL